MTCASKRGHTQRACPTSRGRQRVSEMRRRLQDRGNKATRPRSTTPSCDRDPDAGLTTLRDMRREGAPASSASQSWRDALKQATSNERAKPTRAIFWMCQSSVARLWWGLRARAKLDHATLRPLPARRLQPAFPCGNAKPPKYWSKIFGPTWHSEQGGWSTAGALSCNAIGGEPCTSLSAAGHRSNA